MILLSRAEEIILLTVYKLENTAYGVTIREQIFKDIGHYWSFGVIYKTLKKNNETGPGAVFCQHDGNGRRDCKDLIY